MRVRIGVFGVCARVCVLLCLRCVWCVCVRVHTGVFWGVCGVCVCARALVCPCSPEGNF
jgi:hypothetical protein